MVFKKSSSKIIQIFTLTFCMICGIIATAQNDSLKTNVFTPKANITTDRINFNFTKKYVPTNSTWAISDAFSEAVVFQAELNYKNPQNANQSYQLRIGKGGQIYSFRGQFGESVPPQWRRPEKGDTSKIAVAKAPWIDEVWQMVAVDTRQNKPKENKKYFIHQAGVYLKAEGQKQPFYSPIVAEYQNEKEQSYTIVNWGQQAHTSDNIEAKYTSNILYYTKYTNIGNGIIQVDCMIYNFGEDIINHINMPWGGVRLSALEYFFVSNPDNTYEEKLKRFGEKPIANDLTKTGGWMAYSAAADGNSSALGMVFSRGQLNGKNLFRYGFAGGLTKPNIRDYNVFAITRREMKQPISFGKAMLFRYFYVLDSSVEAVKNNILEHQLTEHTLEANYVPVKFGVEDIYYQLKQNGKSLEAIEANTGWKLKVRPYENSYPVFLIQANDGTSKITSNQYHFSNLPYDGKMKSMQLLGFADKPMEAITNITQICAGSAISLDGKIYNNIQNTVIETAIVENAKGKYDELILNNIEVDKACKTAVQVNILKNAANNNIIITPTASGLHIDLKADYKKIKVKLSDKNGNKIFKEQFKKIAVFDINRPARSGNYLLDLNLGKGQMIQVQITIK